MPSRSPLRTLAIALAAVAGIAAAGLAGPAAAQNSGSQQSTEQSQPETPNYSEAKLQSFANAAVKISPVMREYIPQMRQAQQNGDREALRKLQLEAKKAMDEKIAATDGISTREWQEISRAAREDDQLREKLRGMIDAQQQNQGQ